VFSLDEMLLFAPTDIDMTITPQAIEEAIAKEEVYYYYALYNSNNNNNNNNN
jgi:hypothetical protein